MSAKTITANAFNTADEFTKVSKLTETIKKSHTAMSLAESTLKAAKKEITDISKGLFFKDMDSEEVDVHGSHEYQTGEGLVKVVFKVKNEQMNTLNDKDAKTVLHGLFEDGYKTLFNESERRVLSADKAAMFKQAKTHPEMFGIQLKSGLSNSDLMELIKKHPTMFEIAVSDLEAYAKEYPTSVKTNTTVSLKSGFLNNVEKLEKTIRIKAKGFLKAFLKDRISPAVDVGYRGK